jgi:hypothetical protein
MVSFNTVQDRINNALNGNYTALINAIIKLDVDEVRNLINNGANVNEKDNVYGWLPVKWTQFVYEYGPEHTDPDEQEKIYDIMRLLWENRAREYDDNEREGAFNFSPVIVEETETEVEGKTEGGSRKRKLKTKKSKKTKKSRKSKKRRYTKRNK